MSTGLTWVTLLDSDSPQPDFQTAPVQFSDYDEAKKYALYTMNTLILIGAPTLPIISIYTTSPNSKGYVYNAAGVAAFNSYEG
jgi:hypothetical protein